jgi:tungstate transport system substrate-binding protein
MDEPLVNAYLALGQPESATPGAAWAAKFTDFIASDEGQKIILDYTKEKYAECIYNVADYAKKYDDLL